MPSQPHEDPLSDDELKKIRAIIESDSRAKWLWASIRTWATWVAAVVLGITVGWDSLVKLVRAASGR